jgi:hypothetical protein
MTDEAILPNFELVTRAGAKQQGKKRYFTGKPCRHGHISERYVLGAACAECVDVRRDPALNYARVKAWRAKNPHKRTEEARKYREKYPEKIAAKSKRWRDKNIETRRPIEAEYARKRRKSDPEGNRRRIKAFKERQERKITEVAGRPRASKCEICLEKGKTVFDHCHNSGMFRGWICDRCNKTLGMVKDSPKLLKKLARYLEANDVKVNDEGAECLTRQRFCGTASFLPD